VTSYAYNDPAPSSNPFPGLRPFEPEEDYLFFGRERQTDELLRKLRTTRFLSILGRSGSGKSSLVRSGLIPTLWGGGMTHAGSRWRVVIMRPGEDPLGNLAAALSARGALYDEDYDEDLTRGFFETTLRASSLGIAECIRQSHASEGNNILVLVDQFEEIFRYKRSRRVVGHDEAAAFVKLLLAARESEVPCYVAVTMRSDFIGDCMEFGQLPTVINDGLYLVPRMSRDELKAAIAGPVGVGGATIAPRLVSRLLNDVGDDPDQLPILQHALMRTWEQWENGGDPDAPLDLAQYEAIGTMEFALSRHAEACFSELDASGQIIAEKLLKALTDKGSDVRGVRRPAPMSEICALTGASLEDVTAVVDTFRKPGRSFLMPPAGVPLRPDSILDISHESLMRVWGRLAEWANEEARSGQLYVNVAKAALHHEEGVAALWRDPELQLALTWRQNTKPTAEWASRYDTSFARAMNFLDASKTERDREVSEKEARRIHQLRQARRLVAVFSVISVVMLALVAFALKQTENAHQHQIRAEQEAARAEIESAVAKRQKAKAESEFQRAEHERAEADRQRANAVNQSLFAVQQRTRAESEQQRAETERLKAEANEREARAKKAEAEVARAEAIKERGVARSEQEKAEKSEVETRRLSRLAAARALALSIPQVKDQQTSGLLALEVDRLYRENGGDPDDSTVFEALLTARERLRPTAPVRQQTNIRAAAIEPDGHSVLAAGDDGHILRVSLDHPGNASLVDSAAAAVRTLAIGGGHMATGGDGGSIQIWNLRNPSAAPQTITTGTAAVSSVAFAPAGGTLAAANIDGSVKLWSVDGSGSPVTLPGTSAKRVTSVAFSGDGKMLAAGRAQGGALLWHLANPSEAPQPVCVGLDVRSVAFRPDGKLIACGSGRGEIVQAPLGGNAAAPPTMRGHTSSVNALSFSRDGAYLASASSDSTVRLWNLKAPSASIVLPGHQSWVWTVGFTPDGDRIVAGGEDRTIRVWPAHVSLLASDLCAAVSPEKRALTEKEWAKYILNVEYRPGSPCR
jgi:energy-coupling factor transporter ATP-binding protein EcfA2